MKDNDTATSFVHPRDNLLSYLEDTLPPEDRAMVAQHIETCEECSNELKVLDHMTRSLRTRKDAFCPEPWELQEYADRGRDPEGKLAGHLATCRLCREELRSFELGADEGRAPFMLRVAFRQNFPQIHPAAVETPAKGLLSTISQWLAPIFRAPAMALGTAAAIVLLVVLMYPGGEMEPVTGLSSVTWDQPRSRFYPKSGLNLMGPEKHKPRTTTVLIFKGFPDPLPQERVDGLYRNLKPGTDLAGKFDFVSPATLKDVLAESGIKGPQKRDVLQVLHKELGLSSALMATVESSRDGFKMELELTDPATCQVTAKKSQDKIAESDLPEKLRAAASELFNLPAAAQ